MEMRDFKYKFYQEYLLLGEQKFYKKLLVQAIDKLILIEKNEYRGSLPNLEYLDINQQFINLYRREGNADYLNLASIFRKAAHKIYRLMLKKKLTPLDQKFLNIVRG